MNYRKLLKWVGIGLLSRLFVIAWTTPADWASDETLSASKFNTHLRDNLNALKAPPSDNYELNEASDYTENSTSFADVDATNLALALTPTGGDVMVHFHGTVALNTVAGIVYFDIDVDGGRIGGDDGILFTQEHGTASRGLAVSFTRLITGLSASSHTIKLQWKVSAGATVTLYAGAGTGNADVHPQFWAREVS